MNDTKDPLERLASTRSRGAATLALLSGAAALPTLAFPLVGDDYFHIEVASRLRDALARGWVLPIDQGGAWWTPPGLAVEYFRPLIVLSFAFDRLFYGVHAPGYHLTNLFLHVAATLLVWGLAKRVIGAGFGAWAAAALFALHPCHTQAVAWISGRTDVLSCVLYLSALLVHLDGRGASRTRLSWMRVGASLGLFALALLAKEMAVSFPAVVVLHGLFRPEGESLARRLTVPVLACVVAGFYFAVRFAMFGGFHPPPAPFAFHLGDAGLLWHLAASPLLYLADLTLFVPADPMITVPFWRAHPLLLLGFSAIVVNTFRGTVQRTPREPPERGWPVLAWGLAWMVVTLGPVAMLTMGEHFLYLPSVGYCILVGSGVPQSPARIGAKDRRALAIVAAMVATVCAVRVGLFARVAFASSRVNEEAAAALDRAPGVDRLLVVDLPASSSLAFPQALRLARPNRSLSVDILSISPALRPSDPADFSQLALPAQDTLELRRDDGFLGTYVERALAGPRASFVAGETIERPGCIITVLDAPGGRLGAFRVNVRDASRTLVLREAPGRDPAGFETVRW
ncbi:MAG TPA: hypothetical protein VKU41_32720 [Polyangiaceae bacterium]|nr:hypothetical protein [Polyangiaceae bacterium]